MSDTIRGRRLLLNLPDATVFLTSLDSPSHYDQLLAETPWQQKPIKLYGREVMQPRLVAWYGDAGATYQYSGASFEPLPWTPLLRTLQGQLQDLLGVSFNSVLLNQYRSGLDSIGFHSDNERELGPEPVIASVSYGAERTLTFKHRGKQYDDVDVPLDDNSLLVMMGETQKNWLHGIKKLGKTHPLFDQGRINLTFRNIVA